MQATEHIAADGEPDLRENIAARLVDRRDQIAADAAAIFPFSGLEILDPVFCQRVGEILVDLLASAVRRGQLDSRDRLVAALRHAILERPLATPQFYTFAYLTERTALDELALDEMVGATSEAWPVVAQLVRRASFDLIGAYSERAQLEPSELAIIDRLTTLYTRPLLDAVLAKEVTRAARFGHPISLVLFDVDGLATINHDYGHGVGDRILERVGILIRTYFREHDWVARHDDDSIGVILPLIDADNASELAERVRDTVEKRLELVDHRTDRPVRVTVSAAVVNVRSEAGGVIDPERLLADAEAAMLRAKQQGKNRVERVDRLSNSARRTLSET